VGCNYEEKSQQKVRETLEEVGGSRHVGEARGEIRAFVRRRQAGARAVGRGRDVDFAAFFVMKLRFPSIRSVEMEVERDFLSLS